MKVLRIFTFIIWICAINLVVSTPNPKEPRDFGEGRVHSRSKRIALPIWFPYNSCIAFAVVLAIPLGLKHRNVYMSYNFETNFYIPYFDKKQGLVPLPFATIDAPAVNQGTKIFYAQGGQVRNLNDDTTENESSQSSDSSSNTEPPQTNRTESKVDRKVSSINSTKSSSKQNEKQKQSEKMEQSTPKKERVNREILTTLLSRKKLYKILEHKLDLAGFNGEECLLKTICDTAEHPLEQHNGVLGDIIHIIFTPTTSRDEKLPQRYYDAITDGESGRCRYYNTLCPKGIFDFITKIIM